MIYAMGAKAWQQQLRSKTALSGTLLLLVPQSCRFSLAFPSGLRRIAPICSTSSIHQSTKNDTATVAVLNNTRSTQDAKLESAAVADDSAKLKDEDVVWLVVGDGDLSYSASIAPQLAKQGVQLVASVLEGEEDHRRVFRNSKANQNKILASSVCHNVLYSIDAKRLHDTFLPHEKSQQPAIRFDRIIFNFPHWRGKTNHRYNRELLKSFFASAAKVLKRPHGELHVVLRAGQGGATATTLEDWKRTWMAPYYAAENDLMLRRLEPYMPGYELSSYRGRDRSFPLGSMAPRRYVFTFAEYEKDPVDPLLQLCCRHEIRLMLSQNVDTMMLPASELDEKLFYGDTILEIAQKIVPEGIRVEVPLRHLLARSETGWSFHALVFLVVYVGERVPMKHDVADGLRLRLEEEVLNKLGYDLAKKGRPPSRPFPYPIAANLVKTWLF